MPSLVAAVTPLGLIPPISRPIRVVNTSTVERLYHHWMMRSIIEIISGRRMKNRPLTIKPSILLGTSGWKCLNTVFFLMKCTLFNVSYVYTSDSEMII